MRKYLFEIILISFIFVYENTLAYWIYQIGELSFYIELIYIFLFLFTIVIALYNICKCIKERFRDKKHNIVTILMIIVLIMPFLMTGGLITKRIFYKGELLVAYLDGVAGNNGRLTLYGNNTYEYNYGRIQQKGKYEVKSDTIYFDSPRRGGTYKYDYATLQNDRPHLTFGKDSIANHYMKVVQNDLIK